MEKNYEVENTEKNLPKLDIYAYPYIKDNVTTAKLMLDVIIALIPATIGSVYFFGLNAALLIAVSIVSCVAFEYLMQKFMKKKIRVGDLSAVVTGLLLALNIPASAPIWLPIFGAFFAIVIIKESFGGIGFNFINPALGARAMLMASWGTEMTTYMSPDGISSATPMQVIKAGNGMLPSLADMAIGNIGGVLGETSAVLLLIGGLYLIIKKVIDWKIPVIFILTTAVLSPLFGVEVGLVPYEVLGGGLFLGAFFMATDYTTTPDTELGGIIFAAGCGLITALIRVFGSYPEGVSYAILIMNVVTPVIDKHIQPKVFGEVKTK